MLQPFAVADATREVYRRYVRASFPLRDPALAGERESLVDQGLLWTDPFVSLGRPGTTGPPLTDLAGTLDERTLALPWGFTDLYDHQHQAIQRLHSADGHTPQNTLVLSDTGSGKTESFLIPIIDTCLRTSEPGVKAIVLYPMNALANDQLSRLTKLLADAPEVSFGRYTGDAPETDAGDDRRAGRPADLPANVRWSRDHMRNEPPDILLTNYSMLEYLLLRRKDQELFAHQAVRYLVVDEIHLFSGVLGAEVACLLRRFRQHLGLTPTDLCAVGTSATAGSKEETGRLVAFAERFFGMPFDEDAAIEETPAPLRPEGTTTPPAPALIDDDLAAAHDVEGLAALAGKVFGVELAADTGFREALGDVIDDYRTVGVVERALERPAPISGAALRLGALPERSDASPEHLYREATALILLGAAAHQRPVGEEDPEPRFRPRVHQIVRSLAGLWRCIDPDCAHLAPPTAGRCDDCSHALTFPVTTCRTCGEGYWSAPFEGDDVAAPGQLQARDYWRGEDAIYLATPAQLKDAVQEGEDGGDIPWSELWLCPTCGGKGPLGGVQHQRACPTPNREVELRASTDAIHCPACGDMGAGGRPILLPLRGSAAASVAVLTQALSDELRHREGDAGARLLVFADSRQDAAQQAGYADDQGARIAVRQLLIRALDEAGPANLYEATGRVRDLVVNDPETLRRWLIGEANREFAQLSHPDYTPSTQDEESVAGQLTWEIALDVTERARRRFTLEREGLIVVAIDRLDEIVDTIIGKWPGGHPFVSPEEAQQIVHAVVDMMRYRRAVDHWMLRLTPRELRRKGIRIGDRAVAATRGWGEKKYEHRGKQVDIRSWTSGKHVTAFTELFQRVLVQPHADVIPLVEAFTDRLKASGLLTKQPREGRTRWMVDHKRLILSRREDEQLYRCRRCGAVRSAALVDADGQRICANWRCPGRTEPWEPADEHDFYRRQYRAEPRRLLVREHSGQISGDERIALEERFNDREQPTVDVLACTPTLEVGVSLDDLNSVILRNLPPTPANYAQRIGRAGRRSKVALALTHAGAGPHDTYYFEHPELMIAGDVRAPAISLDNEPLLRRHVNSLVFEVLGEDLPARWVPRPGDDDEERDEETIANQEGVLRESALEPFSQKLEDPATRSAVLDVIRGAFASPDDPAPAIKAERICTEQLDEFMAELRVALQRWCGRFRRLLDEHQRIAGGLFAKLTDEDRRQRDRLEQELRRLMEPRSPEYLPLGFLGTVGFLPRYGFTGTSVLLHPPGGEEPINQAGAVAVTEYAPENIVYARGRRLKVSRLDPAPVAEGDVGAEHRDNVIRDARRCDSCDFLTFDPLQKSCPTCTKDLLTQKAVTLTGVRASGGAISSDDEYRSRADYDVAYLLGGGEPAAEIVHLAGFELSRYAGREIIVANRGPRPDGDDHAQGFEICTGCGHAEATREDDEDEDEQEPRGHATRCPGRKDSSVIAQKLWLAADLRGDVMELQLPPAARGPEFASWRTTLAEALQLGMREILDADRRDLGWFERRQNELPWSLVIYDTMPGGTGYLPKLFADEAAGLKSAAQTALERLESCDCERSCHRCLQDFWNQRAHHQLDRHEVLAVLRRLAGAEPREGLEAENDEFESFLEREFFDRLKAAGLPAPTLQVTRQMGAHGRRRLVTRVDATFADPDVSIYLDGRIHITSVDKVADDLDKRNGLEAKGQLVLEFTFEDVMHRFDDVATALRRALEQDEEDADLDPAGLPGIRLEDSAEKTRAVAYVNPTDWVADAKAWRASLRSANRLRLAGWRLKRVAETTGAKS